MSTVAVSTNTSMHTVYSGDPPARQRLRKRTTVAALSTRSSNRDVVAEEEEVSVSQTGDSGYGNQKIREEIAVESIPGNKIATFSARRPPWSPSPSNNNHNPTKPSTNLNSPKTRGRGSLCNLGGRVFLAFFLFILVARLGTTVWNWTVDFKSLTSMDAVSFRISEERITELEDFLKKTTNMMKVQLELQVENLRQELEKRIGEQTNTFLTELRNLKAHTLEIEDSLVKLTGIGILSREDILGLVNSVLDTRAVEGKGQALSLDDVRAAAKRIVEEEIGKHPADRLGKVDYALGSAGGKVVRHSEGYFVSERRNWVVESLNLFRRSVDSIHPFAQKVLEPNFGQPGQCLTLKGSNAFVEIALRTSILPEAVTLEHCAKSFSYDRSSAPKDFRIIGWLNQHNEDANKGPQQMFFLGEFGYDLEKSSAQTFNLPVDSTRKLINMIKLEILSNHGSSSYTCIYRLRVHGSKEYLYISHERNGSYS